MAEELLSINPFAQMRLFREGVTPDNIDDFLDGVDVLVDSIDFFNLDIRRALFKKARMKGIHAVTAGPIGFGSALLIFAPDRGMDFDRYFDISDNMSLEEKLIAFFAGLVPKAAHRRYTLPGSISMSDRRGPSLGAGCQMCAAAVTAEVLRIILKKPGMRPAPCYAQYDPFVHRFHQGRLWFGNRGPLQRFKRRLLKSRIGAGTGYLVEPKPQIPDSTRCGHGEISAGIRDYLLQAAVRAPSGDNCQPWHFVVHDHTVKILLDASADRSFFNVAQSASLISCGAAAENLVLAAGRFGLCAGVDLKTAGAGVRIDITLKQGASGEDPLQRFIWERHTNRTLYDRSPLDKADAECIRGAAEQFGDTELILLTEPAQIRAVARLVFKVDQIRSTHRGLHEQLMRMIRFTQSEAPDKRDGFALKNLEAGAAGEWLLRHTRSWPVMSALNRVGLGKMIAMISYQGVRSASAVGLLKVKSGEAHQLIEGGRALERIWLTVASLGLDLQPMTAATLFRMRWQMGGATEFSPSHRKLLNRLWPRYEKIFDVQNDSETHIMLFRIGRGRPVGCRTLRKPLTAFTRMHVAPS
jgi:sulfur-carrier protein adenylyltransferase/sulfurtransferase